MEKTEFIHEFTELLRRVSVPRHLVLDWIVRKLRKKSKRFRIWEMNNPDVFRVIEDARDIPVERARMLINDLYNAVNDKKDPTAPSAP